MFSKFTNQKPIADMIKQLIYDSHVRGQHGAGKKQRALDALIVFEGAQWQPKIFEAIVRDVPGRFYFDAGSVLAYEADKPPRIDILDAITQLLEQYIEQVGSR